LTRAPRVAFIVEAKENFSSHKTSLFSGYAHCQLAAAGQRFGFSKSPLVDAIETGLI
jgi:hypothetical protein